MTQYEGLCIGGPLDGTMKASDMSRFTVPEQEEILRHHSLTNAKDATIPKTKEHVYRYEPALIRFQNGTVNAWLHESVPDAFAATEMVFQFYAKKRPETV